MADDPIQADDGGSTRLKLHLRSGSRGAMNTLLDVEKLSATGKPYHDKRGSQKQVNQNGSVYGNVRIACVDIDGKAFDFCGAEDSAIGGALAITISQTLMTRGVW